MLVAQISGEQPSSKAVCWQFGKDERSESRPQSPGCKDFHRGQLSSSFGLIRDGESGEPFLLAAGTPIQGRGRNSPAALSLFGAFAEGPAVSGNWFPHGERNRDLGRYSQRKSLHEELQSCIWIVAVTASQRSFPHRCQPRDYHSGQVTGVQGRSGSRPAEVEK